MKAEPTALADDAPHLLLVDDDRRIRALLSRFLLSEGYRVTTAESATEARAKLAGLRFGLMVLHVMVPGKNSIRRPRPGRDIPKPPLWSRGGAGGAGEPHRGAGDWRRRLRRQAV